MIVEERTEFDRTYAYKKIDLSIDEIINLKQVQSTFVWIKLYEKLFSDPLTSQILKSKLGNIKL